MHLFLRKLDIVTTFLRNVIKLRGTGAELTKGIDTEDIIKVR
jgi:hypothetical protein